MGKYQTFTNEEGKESNSIDEIIDRMGLTRFHLKLVFVVAVMQTGVIMQATIINVLGPVLKSDWRLHSTEEALLTTAFFVGTIVGGVFTKVSDIYGRRVTMILMISNCALYALLSGFAPNYIWMMVLRFLCGICYQSSMIACTYFVEFLPTSSRGKLMPLMEIAFACGSMFETVLAYICMDWIGWRGWLMLSTFPLFLYPCISNTIPPSPRYLFQNGRQTEARAVLAEMAVGSDFQPANFNVLGSDAPCKTHNLSEIFTQSRLRTTVLLILITIITNFLYYGIILISAEIITMQTGCLTATWKYEIETEVCYLDVIPPTKSEYLEFIWNNLQEFPAILVNVLLLDVFGRLWLMRVLFLVFSVSMALLYVCVSRIYLVILLCVARAAISAALRALFTYIPEVYPTHIRGQALGFLFGLGYMGPMVVPTVAVVLTRYSVILAVGMFMLFGLMCTGAAGLLNVETKGRPLDDHHS